MSTSTAATSKRRPRAVIACETCRDRRVRCDGEDPCAACVRGKIACKYRLSSRRVTVSQREYMELLRDRDFYKKRCEEGSEDRHLPSASAAEDPVAGQSAPFPPSPATSGSTPVPISSVPEEAIIEGQGQLLMDESGVSRYMGDISGPVFYTALLSTLNATVDPEHQYHGPHPQTTYQTWDSRPLPPPSSDPFILPPRRLAEHMVALFFINMREVFPFLEPVSFDLRVSYVYGTTSLRSETWLLAQFYAVLALSSLHVSQPTSDMTAVSEVPPGIGYLSSAISVIPNLIDATGMLPAQTMSLIAFYLLAISHRDGAYSSIGSAIQCAVSCGMHQLSRGSDANQEAHFSTFWTIVDLDRLICCTLGRPLHLSSTDMVTPRPSETSQAAIATSTLQARLLQELYRRSSKPRRRKLFSLPAAQAIIKACQEALEEERRYTHPTQNPRSSALRKMALQQIVIVASRPAYLACLKMRGPVSPHDTTGTVEAGLRNAFSQTMQQLFNCASEAARDMVQSLELLKLTGLLVPWSFFDVHYAYNAGMVFLLERLSGQTSTTVAEREYLERTVEDLLTFLAVNGHDSATSCLNILQYLRQNATTNTQSSFDEEFWNIFGVSEPVMAPYDGSLDAPLNDAIDADLDSLLQSIGVSWE